MPRIGHAVLTALPDPPGVMTLAALLRATKLAPAQAKAACDRLSKRGLIVHAGIGRYQRSAAGTAFIASGDAVRAGPPRGPREELRPDRIAGRDTLRDRAWRALRQLKKATLPEIIELAARGTEREPVSNLRRYFWTLERHGLVAKLRHRVPGLAPTSNGFIRLVLVHDLGPLAPIWRARRRELVDRNRTPPAPVARPEGRR